MSSASAQEAQNAAGANRSADRKPKPPIRIGSVDNCCASASLSLGMSPKSSLAVCHIPSIVGATVNR